MKKLRIVTLLFFISCMKAFSGTVLHSEFINSSKDSTIKVIDTISYAGSEIEPLPIIMYDTDIGFGYGLKGFLLNQLSLLESFDLVLFNSTKGERWYRLVFSLPDFELRQGKIYSSAFDLYIDYDKYIKYYFYGVGNNSHKEDIEELTKETLEISTTFSRAFTNTFSVQSGIKYKVITNSNILENSKLTKTLPDLNTSSVKLFSVFIKLNLDSRNSFINPSSGRVLSGTLEYIPETKINSLHGIFSAASYQEYAEIFIPGVIYAGRVMLKNFSGNIVPVQMMNGLGGVHTLRGFPLDRFTDRISCLINNELRLPLYSRFGGIAGIDAGTVWSSFSEMSFSNWAYNYVFGLRYYFDTFIVRLDFGFSKENEGIYFNFGHLF